MVNETLKPGSNEAVEAGCTCPIFDNYKGEGIPIRAKDGTIQRGYWMSADCPLHGIKDTKKED